MSNTKKTFIFFALVFFLLLAYASYDISRRTTFPGSKPQLKERLKEIYVPRDTSIRDSIGDNTPKN